MKKLLLMISILALVMACSKDTFKNSEVKVENGKIKSPEWLAERINGAVEEYNKNPDTLSRITSTSVHLIKYNGREYILIMDGLSSLGWGHCFTISGEFINPGSSLYSDLSKVDKWIFIWSFWSSQK